MDKHVCGFRHPEKHGQTVWMLQVQDDAEFPPIRSQEGSRLFWESGRILAERVARGRLNLDNLGAQVGKKRAAVRPSNVGC